MRGMMGKAVLLAAAIGLAVPALAATPGDPEALISATATLKAKLDGAAKTDQPPLLTNGDAALVRTAFDADTVRAIPANPDVAGRACTGIGLAIVAYVDFGNRQTGGGSALDAFVIKIQNEMTLSAVAANLCLGRGFLAVEPIVAKMDAGNRTNIAPALRQMHDGADQTINGSLSTVASPEFSAANRASIVAALIESAPPIAASFSPADRAAMHDKVLGYVKTAPADIRAKINALAAIYAKPDCNAICKASGGN
ncbi:hypothetical protein [Sphingomonas sp.]|uniref:hypothetical protein n=1 Tax=Sphingomonas sp. TaxID=28214 RepID=UPI001B01395C|nr:hypothetical protein [Sphingomonas sp.]MBO9714128.1 hypothetical protein [Sphingomonas sp.]